MTKNRSNFKMGTVEMIILFLLNKKDLYGYEITSLVEKLSEGNIGITESTLYPTLYKLLGNKYISDREVQVGKRRTRVYYHLEETGKEHLEKLTIGAELPRQPLNRLVTLHIGDDMNAVAGGEILVEDGKIIAFRE